MTGLNDFRACMYCSGPSSRIAAAGHSSAVASDKPCVLVVDDEPSAVAALARALKSCCRVVTASSAEAALEKLEHVFVDVVLTDYHLGGEDGLWLLEQAQARYPRVRRVLVSGDEVANATKLIAAGALHAFVPKPIALATLLAALKVEWR